MSEDPEPKEHAVALNLRMPAETTSVSLAHLTRFVNTKKDLHKVLRIRGQIFLPPYTMCTLEFMGQILRREKKCFMAAEVTPVQLSTTALKFLTIKRILEKVKGDAHILSYLPDQPEKHVTKDYLLGIINAVDPTFCLRVQKEVEEIRRTQAASKTKAPPTIEIDRSMLALIEQFESFGLEQRRSNVNTMTGLVRKREKRTRTMQANQYEFNTRVDAKTERVELVQRTAGLMATKRPFQY
jgi:hypothetical protein